MECLEKPIWSRYDKKELEQLSIDAPDEEIRKKVLANWDSIAKPLDGMGSFETLIAQIGAITRTDKIDISKKAVIIMCADNGIVEEGVTQTGQEATLLVAKSMSKKLSSVCKMARVIGADTIPVDIGINSEEEINGVLNRKIRYGTKNFCREPAMTEEETIRAIAAGIELAGSCKERGIKILATGEMGIGNTTTSSAIAAALLRCGVDKVTGRGAGLSDKGLLRKKQVITGAIEKYDLFNRDAFTVLMTVGGLDIAGLTGVCIGGALYHVPVVLDGVISLVAALVAERILPGTRAYLIPSHKGKEPAMALLTGELEMEPVIDGKLALGEGTGAVMMLSLLDIALSVYNDRTTFSEVQIEQYQRIMI
jgi:nicotinate-nucleotide--dimethylbenzimidazole phosphoribosyltransferase